MKRRLARSSAQRHHLLRRIGILCVPPPKEKARGGSPSIAGLGQILNERNRLTVTSYNANPMRSFNVSLNGKKLCLAGVGERGVLSAIISWVGEIAAKTCILMLAASPMKSTSTGSTRSAYKSETKFASR